MIPKNAPFDLPRLAIRCADPNDPMLSHPHIEDRKSGLLCLARSEDVFADPGFYPDTCLHLLRRGVGFIGEDWEVRGEEDFRLEWLSYWSRDADVGMPSVHIAIDDLCGINQGLISISTKAGWIIADDQSGINRLGRSLGISDGKYDAIPVPVLILDQPLTPKQFPKTARDVFDLFDGHGHGHILERFMNDIGPRIAIWLLACQGISGYSIAGGRLDLRPLPIHRGFGHASGFIRREKQLIDGFRRMPPPKIMRSRMRSTACGRFSVERYDHSWIHGRQHDKEAGVLKDTRVVIIGAGSLGSGIAEFLIKSGVGELHLVDNDKVHPENISRHVLGSPSVGMYKSKALAGHLARHDPSITVIGHVKSGQEWLADIGRDSICRFHLAIDATGDWPFSLFLDAFMRDAPSFHPPIVWTWLEAHCLAAHAVLTTKHHGCIRCALHNDGRMRMPALTPSDFTVDVAACGGAFQPYGAVSLASAHSMAADLAIESLLNPDLDFSYRVWLSGRRRINSINNAIIHSDWERTHGMVGEWPALIELKAISCGACGRSAP